MKTISVDPTGAAAIAKAIPKDGWNKMVNVACNTFSDLVAPLTNTTAGLGGLIEGRFKAMIDVQKVFAADALARARKKFDSTARLPSAPPKAKVLLPAIESASLETDDELRDIWANLIANEMLDASVHPEFPSILSRLGPHDARVLSEIARNNTKSWVKAAAQKLASSISIFGVTFDEPGDFSREHLNRLGLIKRPEGTWALTHFGEEFVKAVTDPNASRDAERSEQTARTHRRDFHSADNRTQSARRR